MMMWRKVLCFIGFHNFGVEGWVKYGARLICQHCGGTFVMVRDGSTDLARFDRVDT